MNNTPNFDRRLLQPLYNQNVEKLARILALQANFIRDLDDNTQYESLPDEPRYTFRMMAIEYAETLGVDPHDKTDDSEPKTRDAPTNRLDEAPEEDGDG